MAQQTWIGRLMFTVLVLVIGLSSRSDAQVGLNRKILLQQDLDIPGYETILAEAFVAVGGREGKHKHPGTLIGYILEGEMDLELEGHPTKSLKPGDSLLIPAGQVHEGINKGKVPIKALVTFVVKKGEPLTTSVP